MDSFAFENPRDICVSTSFASQGAVDSSRKVPTWKSQRKQGEVTLVCAGASPSPPGAFAALLPWLLHAGQRIKLLLLVLTSPLVRLTVHEQNGKD